MLSGAQDCFQLIRIGSSAGDSARDLYTFRPALSHCVFRLGRVAEFCDVTLNSTSVSRVHAELHTERQVGRGEEAAPEEGWKVSVKDRSSHGTWVNDVRLQSGVLWELSDGDTLIFGGQSTPGNPEFYFLFQKVKVRPQDFDAITIPKTGAFSSDLERRIRTSQDCKSANSLDLSRLSINTSTIILNSIGSLSKMKGTSWTFQRSHSHDGTSSDPGSSSSSSPTTGFTSLVPPVTSPTLAPITSQSATKAFPPASRSRRKSAHTVLLEDVGSDELRSRAAVVPVLDDGTRVRAKKRRRLYRSDGLVSPPPLPPQPKAHAEVRHQHASKPFPVGIRTIGSFHGAMTNSQLGGSHALQSFRSSSAPDAVCRVQTLFNRNITSFCHQKGGHRSAQRGRQRLHSAPVFSPLVVGGENYSRASPSVRVRTEERSRVPFQRFHHPTSKRRGRPRKHPLPPRPSLPSPSSSSSSSSSSTSSASSSSGSSSSSSDDDDDDEEGAVTGSVEPCAALRCRLPQQDTVQWIQCDVCDAWYHIDCLHVDRKKLLMDPKADFHCGCR